MRPRLALALFVIILAALVMLPGCAALGIDCGPWGWTLQPDDCLGVRVR